MAGVEPASKKEARIIYFHSSLCFSQDAEEQTKNVLRGLQKLQFELGTPASSPLSLLISPHPLRRHPGWNGFTSKGEHHYAKAGTATVAASRRIASANLLAHSFV